MKILYLADDNIHSTSFHRAKALERAGHEVVIFNPYKAVSRELNSRFRSPFHYRTGYFFLQSSLRKWTAQLIADNSKPDLVWVNGGELFGKKVVSMLKKWGVPVVLYNNDDPTGKRDGKRFASLLKALPEYTHCLVLRNINVDEYKKRGVINVLRVYMSYDEEIHRPFINQDEIPLQFRSDVAFIGTWMKNENRDKFLSELIRRGLNVSIWGNSWQKSPLWEDLKPYYRGKGLGGRDYVAAIQGARICIGMLSKGNRDLHTRRSVEVPYIGGLFCAERTSEHMEMYKENEEAVFWDDAEECSRICHQLLKDDQLRKQIRSAGMKRVRELKVGNEDIVRQALEFIFAYNKSQTVSGNND